MSDDHSRRILVGRFGAPHGVRGELRLQSFTQDPQAIGAYAPLFDESGRGRYKIVSLRPVKGASFVVRIEGVTTREAAAALTNQSLYIERDNLPEPEEEEFYLADLIGLSAFARDESGAELPFGRVKDVLNFGGGDIIEIEPPEGGETIFLPFTRAVVPELDLAARRLVVVPPDEIEAREETPTDDEAAADGGAEPRRSDD